MAGHTNNRLFGLIGYPLSHSFSKGYFSKKFEKEDISDARYELFPLQAIERLPALLESQPELVGLNVTIPYKEAVIPYLDDLEEGAARVGAVNTIKIEEGKLRGFNTDVYGFEKSLSRALRENGVRAGAALVLGTGGAAKAVAYVLQKMEIPFRYVSRRVEEGFLDYADLDRSVMDQHRLIVNTTPLGMSPEIEAFPDIPYQFAGPEHLFFDLVYNPEMTAFLAKAGEQGAKTVNGLEMLYLQAEEAWRIWNEKNTA